MSMRLPGRIPIDFELEVYENYQKMRRLSPEGSLMGFNLELNENEWNMRRLLPGRMLMGF